jgi:hypothetical protein
MTTVNVTTPLPKCPEQKLITGEITYSDSLFRDKTACLGGKQLYNDADIRKQCPYPKTQEQCMDGIRSKSILDVLTSQKINACGNLQVLADEVEFCSKGMNSVTRSIIQNPSSPEDAQITAKIIRQTCRFE